MKTWRWMMTLAAGGALVAACSVDAKPTDDDGGTGGSGGSATTTTTTGGPQTTATTTTATTATTTGGGTGICGTTLGFESEALNACITGSCCPDFDACNDDAACMACLTGSGSGCDTNTLYNTFLDCADANCPTDMCDTGIGFTDNTTMDPIFACNACGDMNCCAGLTQCVGDMMQTTIDNCIACLNGDASCDETTMPDQFNGANTFNDCIGTECATECGG